MLSASSGLFPASSGEKRYHPATQWAIVTHWATSPAGVAGGPLSAIKDLNSTMPESTPVHNGSQAVTIMREMKALVLAHKTEVKLDQ